MLCASLVILIYGSVIIITTIIIISSYIIIACLEAQVLSHKDGQDSS